MTHCMLCFPIRFGITILACWEFIQLMFVTILFVSVLYEPDDFEESLHKLMEEDNNRLTQKAYNKIF